MEFKGKLMPIGGAVPINMGQEVVSKSNTKGATAHSVDTLSAAGLEEESHGPPLHLCKRKTTYHSPVKLRRG